MAEDVKEKADVKESAREVAGAGVEADLARLNQEKPDSFKKTEADHEAMRLVGETPSSADLPPLDFFENQHPSVSEGLDDQPVIGAPPDSPPDELFKKVDTDRDGFLSEDELEAASKDKQFEGMDKQTIEAWKKHREEIEELSDDEWCDEDDGISMKDLQMIDYIANLEEIKGYALKNFDYLDADRDGKLSEEDLRQRLKEMPRDNVLGRHAIKAMLARMDDMEVADDEWGFEGGISRKDLEEFKNDPEQNKLRKDYDKETRGW